MRTIWEPGWIRASASVPGGRSAASTCPTRVVSIFGNPQCAYTKV